MPKDSLRDMGAQITEGTRNVRQNVDRIWRGSGPGGGPSGQRSTEILNDRFDKTMTMRRTANGRFRSKLPDGAD